MKTHEARTRTAEFAINLAKSMNEAGGPEDREAAEWLAKTLKRELRRKAVLGAATPQPRRKR